MLNPEFAPENFSMFSFLYLTNTSTCFARPGRTAFTLKNFILERRLKELPSFALRKSLLGVCLSCISQREISTVNSTKPLTTLDPYYITRFSDGEASFVVFLTRNERLKTGWQLDPRFSIELHIKDLNILEQIKAYFGVGTVYVRTNRNSAIYYVIGKDLIKVIIPHFSKFPLITQKQADFLLFKQIVELMNQKEHLNIEGLQKILRLKASMNTGLSEQKKRLSGLNLDPPIERPFVEGALTLLINWFYGWRNLFSRRGFINLHLLN